MTRYSEGTIIPGSKRAKELYAAARNAVRKKFESARFKQTASQEDFDEKALAYEMANKLEELQDELMEGEEEFHQQWLKKREASDRRQAEIKAGYVAEAKARAEEVRRQIKQTPQRDEEPTGEWEVIKDANGKVVNLKPRYSGRDAYSPARRAGPREQTNVFTSEELNVARGGRGKKQEQQDFLQKAGAFFKKLVS